MVVAQIPLWILHSTNNGSVGPGDATATVTGGHPSFPSLGSSPKSASTATAAAAAAAATQGGGGGGVPKKLSNAKSQLNLWSTNPSGSNRCRSAIYCCDISMGRIATGGGDGKIRLWSLACLFASSKCDVSSGRDGGFDGGDGGKSNKKKSHMAIFRNGGGYDSSDSSESSSSDQSTGTSHKITSSTTKPTSTNNNNNDETSNDNNDQNNSSTPPNNADPYQYYHQTNTPTTTSSPTPHNTSTNQTSTNKKRKRALLLTTTTPTPTLPPSSSSPPSLPTYSPHRRSLCTLSSHSGSVLALRFSPSSTYLASAGDDAHVLLYMRTDRPPSHLRGGGNLIDVGSGGGGDGEEEGDGEGQEYWERIRILRGHNLDVVGLAWAPDDSHLVSCSLDSGTPICVWRLDLDSEDCDDGGGGGGGGSNGMNGQHHLSRHNHRRNNLILHPYKILGRDVHTSTVKGVAFDPAGKYVASSGDDPAVCIWRAFDDWGLEERIDSSAGIFHSRGSSSMTTTPRKSLDDRDGGGGGGDGGGVGTDGGGVGGGSRMMDVDEDDEDNENDDVQALASLSLFRRIDFAPDGTHVCGTNATLKGKNIAAMIGRDGWGVSGAGSRRRKSSGGGSASHGAGGNGGSSGGAANLVGHKQPVVSSRHCPYFFEVEDGSNGREDDDDDDEDVEPHYSTLVALGDKKGFVTIWSTRKCKPIFKLQCSESRCTVTDISWGLIPSPTPTPQSSSSSSTTPPSFSQSLALVISLLDGYVVALCLHTPSEVGAILSDEKRDRIFRLKYGIESFPGAGGGLLGGGKKRRRLVDDKSGPKLIENVLQYNAEQQGRGGDNGDDDDISDGGELFSDSEEDGEDKGGITPANNDDHDTDEFGDMNNIDRRPERRLEQQQQQTISSSGKRRVQPVLVSGEKGAMLEERIAAPSSNSIRRSPSHTTTTGGVDRNGEDYDTNNNNINNTRRKSMSKSKKKDNTVRDALQSAEKAASAAEGVSAKSIKRDHSKGQRDGGADVVDGQQNNQREQMKIARPLAGSAALGMEEVGGIQTVIPPGPSQTIYTVDLTPPPADAKRLKEEHSAYMSSSKKVVASCTNSIQKVPGFHGSFLCATLSISCGGKVTWKDQIVGTHCTALASTGSLMIVGTNDGTIYIYGTSPSLGWKSGIGFRSHPPFIMGTSVVRLSIRQTMKKGTAEEIGNGIIQCEMLVVMADGTFGVYRMMPSPTLSFKGSILMPMNQMRISSKKALQQGDASTVPFPKLARIQMTESNHLLLILSSQISSSSSSTTVGGMLQGFLYNRDMELWMRVSDNRFMFSSFYSTVPGTKFTHGLLSKLDRTVQQTQTSNNHHRRGGGVAVAETSAAGIYQNNNEEDHLNLIFTRSHCEDRIACALALQSTSDFRYWLSQYIRRLASEGNESHLRFVVDMLLDKVTQTGNGNDPQSRCEDVTGNNNYQACWWLFPAKSVLGLNRREAVQQVVIPEISKNRSLQRLMNEIATELNVL